MEQLTKKTKEPVAPQTKAHPKDMKVPHFDGSNSAKLTWEQLPDALKNAAVLKTEEKQAVAATHTTASPDGAVNTIGYQRFSYAAGPYGGTGGGPFYIFPQLNCRLYAIGIRNGTLIDAITVWYLNDDGTIYTSGKSGGNGGSYYVQYLAADEYISQVTGHSGQSLDQLTIYTNHKSFAYGGTGGGYFSVAASPGYQIFGFFGRSGTNIDQLGFYIYSR
jgi:hypothetical protein